MDNTKMVSSRVTNRIVTEQELLKIYDISLDEWEVERKIINTWEVGAKDNNNNIVTTPLFQVKLWLKRKPTQLLKDIIEEFVNDLKSKSPIVPKKNYPNYNSKNLLEINIFDLHLGKLAWAEETNMDYNIEIACKLFNDSIDHFISKSKHENVNRIVLPIGNDFLNSDRSNPFNSTTRGTPQDEDIRWQNTFRVGRKLLVDNILKLSEIAPVDVIMIPGNHDYERNFFLGDSLEGWFHNNLNVTINNLASPRKYYQYGEVLLGYTHGDNEKPDNLPLIMAQECPQMWAQSKYREFHLGHTHTKKQIKYQQTQEHQGVVVRWLSSLCGTDSFHFKKGYVGNIRTAEAFIWNKDKGLEGQIYYNA